MSSQRNWALCLMIEANTCPTSLLVSPAEEGVRQELSGCTLGIQFPSRKHHELKVPK